VGKGAGAHGDVKVRCRSDLVQLRCTGERWGRKGNSDVFWRECLLVRLGTGYQANSKESHLTAVKRIFRKSTSAPKPSSQTKKVPQGKNLRATIGLKSKRSSKHTSESKTESSKSQTGQSKIKNQSSLAKDKSLRHPSPLTHMVGEMHKEAQQAVGGSTSLGATNEEGAHPKLSSGHDVLVYSTAKTDPGPTAPNDFIPPQQGMDERTKNTLYDHIFTGSNLNVLVDKTKSIGDGLKTIHTKSGASKELGADEISKKIKLKDLADLLKDTKFAFFTPDSPPYEPINV
nr:hypothetical protein [Tanacetum cinerariifolium]GEY83581.1 hypothetical protein [Tanacetum cinerariifolium]